MQSIDNILVMTSITLCLGP